MIMDKSMGISDIIVQAVKLFTMKIPLTLLAFLILSSYLLGAPKKFIVDTAIEAGKSVHMMVNMQKS